MTAVIGFFAGQYYANGASERAFRKARQSLSQLFSLVIESIESAQKTCGMLESYPNLRLSEAQREKLETHRSKLAETFQQIDQRQEELLQNQEEETPIPDELPEPVEIQWNRSPEDELTGMPAREAFDSNFLSLMELGKQTGFQNGLLLVKLDKSEHLRMRFGDKGVNVFLKRIGSLICRSIRDDDLVCRFNHTMFAVLFPAVNGGVGERLSQTIRDTIRHHHFRLEPGGDEVLVTASFGYTSFTGMDSSDLILNRAGTALSKSQKKGRNQLHSHDGQTMTLCAAT
ncbi:MAG: hypothetical protein Tsb009_05070 [Planctomycetaceae bacterium]